jgi:hypothetical protein
MRDLAETLEALGELDEAAVLQARAVDGAAPS